MSGHRKISWAIDSAAGLARWLAPVVPPLLLGKGYLLRSAVHLGLQGGARELHRNRALRATHGGQRCFVVGNGTSLLKLDLTLLRGESIFTVNTFLDHQDQYGLRSFCHLLIDPLYFDPAHDGLRTLRRAGEARRDGTLLFAPLEFQRVVEENAPGSNYLFFSGKLEWNRNLDISRTLPRLQTVTLAALAVAMDLGFSPIYLIGCDMDFLGDVVATGPLRVRVRHFYEDEGDGIVSSPFDYEGFCRAVVRMLAGYRILRDRRGGTRIYNAGAGGLLDAFERVDYATLFPKGEL